MHKSLNFQKIELRLKEKEKNKKWQFQVSILLTLSLICFGFWNNLTEKNELKNSKTTNGTIIEIDKRFKRGFFIKYQFSANNKKISGNQKLTIKRDSIKIGDKFEVNYSEKKPEYSELIFEKRITE